MKFAVVCPEPTMHLGKNQFETWFETKEEAKEVAERLCISEKKEFIVLQEIGRVKLQTTPTVWTE